MDSGYEREKLSLAVKILAVSAEPIQSRLEYAWVAMHTLTLEPLVDPERNKAFLSIHERLTADKSDSTAGHVRTTTARLSDDAASAIARDIVDLYYGICHDRIDRLEDELRATKTARR
jgi:hypothetical protein